MFKKLVPQWWAKGETAEWLDSKKEEYGSITSYVRSLILADMKKNKK